MIDAGHFYKSVLQVYLLFGAESWVMYPCIRIRMGGLQHRVARRLENMQPKRDVSGRWIYPSLDAAMKAVGMEEMNTDALSQQNTATQYIYTWTILHIYLEVE